MNKQFQGATSQPWLELTNSSDRLYLDIDAGLDLARDENFSFSLNLGGSFSENSSAVEGSAKFRLRF